MTEGVDYAWTHPSPVALVAAGKHFACRYLSRDASKNLTRAEADALHAAGIATVSNWEAAPGAARNGFNQGVADATDAAAQHLAAGGPPDRPIYFSVDWDVQLAELGAVDAYFRGVASVIGLARTGAYGGIRAIAHLFDAGLIRWGWQTYAWSGSPTQWDGRAQIQQYSNGVTVGGVDCDLDRATVADYGQWPITTGDDMLADERAALMELRDRARWMDPRLAATADGADTYKDPGNVSKPAHDVQDRRAILAKLDQLLAAASGLTDAQVAAMADRIAAVLAARPDNPLGDADKPAIVAAVKQALTEGVGS